MPSLSQTCSDPSITANKAVTIAMLSFAVSGLVLLVKVAAWWTTHSAVLFADAAESALDLATASMLIFSVRLAARPPDDGHPWGHGKAQYFSAGFQGGLVLLVSIGVAWRSTLSLLGETHELVLTEGIALSTAATVLNLGLAMILIRAGRSYRSPALEADGYHNLSDVVTTIGGWIGLGLAWLTGWWWLDGAAGLVVAANILIAGLWLTRSAIAGLMDAALPAGELAPLLTAFNEVLTSEPGHLGSLRARKSSDRVFVECVLYVPGTTSVHDAHELCEQLEAIAAEVLPGSEVHVHVEPEELLVQKDAPSAS